jgi:hypothetical protein
VKELIGRVKKQDPVYRGVCRAAALIAMGDPTGHGGQ